MVLSGNQLSKPRCCVTPVVFEVMVDSYVHQFRRIGWELAGLGCRSHFGVMREEGEERRGRGGRGEGGDVGSETGGRIFQFFIPFCMYTPTDARNVGFGSGIRP